MQLNVAKEVAALKRMTVNELRAKYAEVFGEGTPGNNKPWLIKRIAWRLQALAEGDLSERARRRAAELANDAELRMNPPRTIPMSVVPAERTKTATLRVTADSRLPVLGSIITRVYKGQRLQVQVLADGFEFEGQRYKSLSAVAKAITGSHCNGYLFFRSTLNGKEERRE
jgi:hypothetical protein